MNCDFFDFQCWIGLWLAVSTYATQDEQIYNRLPSFEANPKTLSVSGQSAGSYLMTMMITAYSQTYIGAGLFIGGNYGNTYLNSWYWNLK